MTVFPGGTGAGRATARPVRRWLPRKRFVVATALLILLVNLLFIEAYVSARFAPDQERSASPG